MTLYFGTFLLIIQELLYFDCWRNDEGEYDYEKSNLVVHEESDFFEDTKSGLLVILNNLHFDSLESADCHPKKDCHQNSRHLVRNVQTVHFFHCLECVFSCHVLWKIEQIDQWRDLENSPEEEHDVWVANFLFHYDCLHREHAHQRHRAAHRNGWSYHNIFLYWRIRLIWIVRLAIFIISPFIIKIFLVAVLLCVTQLVNPKIAIGSGKISLLRHI